MIRTWQVDARSVASVEMELAGVYKAARKPHKEYPILAVRGISDIVGLRRDDGWTDYACHVAASFAHAFFRSGVADGFLTRAATTRSHARDPVGPEHQAPSVVGPAQEFPPTTGQAAPPGGPVATGQAGTAAQRGSSLVPRARTFRFVHLSDIHFGQEAGLNYGPHHTVRRELIRDCEAQANAIGKADGVLINGDIAFSGKKEEFDLAAAWIEELTTAVGCSVQTDVRVVPGNHDVDRSQINYFCGVTHDRLRQLAPALLDAELAKIAASAEESNPLLPKLNNYRVFASRYGCDFETAERLSWRSSYEFDANHRFEIIGLTSVLVCDAADAKDKMILGSNQYIIERVNDLEIFVMVHHPLSWFKDQHDAQRYLDRARVVLTGHEHTQRIKQETTLGGGDSLRVYAGATNAPEISGVYGYRYCWLEFALHSAGDRELVRVTVYPRVWDNHNTGFVADRNALNGAESAYFDLPCPNYRKPPGATPAPPSSSGSPTVVAKGSTMATEPSARDIQRLHYFYWSYLDEWQDRIGILVRLNLLPGTPNQPVPHTLERLALEGTTNEKKLHDLWDEVMRHVPEPKRQSNPFSASKGEG